MGLIDAHEERVEAVARRVRSFHERGVPFRIYHGATNSTRILKKDANEVVDTSALNHVISVDKNGLTAIVEPNVAMDALVDNLLAQGFIPKVVPEFPGITVGGSFSGTAAESSSFREGYFDRTVNWIEVVLADGTVVSASPTQNADLFYGAAGALGTLGVITLLEIQLQRTTKYVKVTYVPTGSITETLLKLEASAKKSTIIFLDAIQFSNNSGIVVAGSLEADGTPAVTEELPIVKFSRPCDPWFFLHAHCKLGHQLPSDCRTCALLSANERAQPSPPMIELVPVKDYLFRYDRGAFWMGSYGWDAMPLPFNRLGRRLLNPLFNTRTMYSVMHHSGQSQRFIVQDLAMPAENAEEFIKFVASELRIWPLWLCPIKGGSRVPFHSVRGEFTNRMTMNIGVWGLPHTATGKPLYYGRRSFPGFILLNRTIEAKVRSLGGLKWLYAHNYATEEEFWQSYDKQAYDELRRKWNANQLPTLWDKVGKEKHEWVPVNVLRGLWRGWLGKDYLLAKR
ncbi:uncharacterized protein PV09_03595 [Verruconis gallopava]|uniref:Delta(24)-sterol reductase n=1 Tax=Verruconis gallopava TaxID=253628 RepID=A0A0D2AFI7_9PEZI|nr:uncharacterized protein PV09_03595 [Verruconis gallopava]KIW05738.1 hypothetical protein PV09_03595 [Verruconis gallopava]